MSSQTVRFKSAELAQALCRRVRNDRDENSEANALRLVEARKIVDAFFSVIHEQIAQGERIEIRGFGAFFMHTTGSAKKFNPIKNQFFEKPDTFRIRFKPSASTIQILQ